MSAPPGGLGRAAASGVVFTASSQVVRQGIQIAVTAVMARHLAPEDFGIVGMAAVALAFAAPLNELGMGAALVQRKDLGPGHPPAVFWCQTLLAAVLALALAAAAPVVAGFFRRPDLTPVLRVLCVGLPLGAASAAPLALLTRDLRFERIALAETAALTGGGLVGVGMALAGWGMWSLAGQSLASAALTCALLFGVSGFVPFARGERSMLSHLRDLVRFSAPLTGYQWLNFLARNLDDILIGRFLGAGALGYYQLAYRLMTYPLQKVSEVVGRVSFPAMASMQEDLARLRHAYLRTVRYIALLTFPMMAALMVAAPEVVAVLFGPAWDPVVPLVRVLALAGMAGSIGTTVGSLFLARGRSDLMLLWEGVATLCYAGAIALGLRGGLLGVAIAYTATSLLLWPASHALAGRLIGLRTVDLFRALLPQAALAALLAAVLAAVKLSWGPQGIAGQAWFLALCAAAAAAALLGAALAGRPAAAGEAAALLREALAGRRAAR